jgi:hypothetical protein
MAAPTSAAPSSDSTKPSAPEIAQGGVRGACSVAKCGRPLRAKGYCRKHFLAWRREELGAHHHYKVCSKEGCRKKRAQGGLCAEHAGAGTPAA